MNTLILNDIIGWDVVNWSKAISFWERQADLERKPLKCLELGGHEGGLSLWLAQKGHSVICSDLDNPGKRAKIIHNKYPNLTIKYESIDAMKIPYENEFDIIIFKSILGGISRDNKDEHKKVVLQQIHKALKIKGKLLFAENLQASKLHQFMRKRFVKWGNNWNYLNIEEVEPLFVNFISLQYKTVGFFGAFGPTNKSRNLFANFDTLIDPFLQKNSQYIIFGIAEK